MHGYQIIKRLSERVQRLPASLANRRVSSLILGAILVTVSIVFAIWAQDLAEASALSGWLRLHPPSEKMWRHALLARGLEQISASKAFQKVSKTLPSLTEEEGKVWMSDHAGWIAVYTNAGTGPALALYCSDCAQAPLGWEPLGNGWEAFDPALARLDTALANRKAAPGKKASEPRDPREIYY